MRAHRVLILAIDTSTDQAGLALMQDGAVRAEWTWTAAGNHSRHVHALLRSLFETEDTRVQALGGIVVATGPGSFSGLRVGVSMAKGLALSCGIPLWGVGTLDAIAFPGSFLADDILATMPAGREQLYVAKFGGGELAFERRSEYVIMLPGEAAELVGQDTVLCGPGSGAVAVELERRGRSARREPSLWSLRRPGFLAELGSRKMAEGATDEMHTLEPLYIRRSAAEEKRLAGLE